MDLITKPDFEKAMERIEAWFEGSIIDRAPVRFSRHNAFADITAYDESTGEKWPSLKDRWFDVDYQLNRFIKSIESRTFLAETFPVFWPNLGPDIYAAFHGCPLEFGETTSWSAHPVKTWNDEKSLEFSFENEYFRKIDELTDAALALCSNNFLVGYTDLHPGTDCAMAWRGGDRLCLDLYDAPEKAVALAKFGEEHFFEVFDYFDEKLKNHGHLSVTWMEIPSFGKMHIPSCDFASMISRNQFERLALPLIQEEVRHMNHNIFHVDGKGVGRHIDPLFDLSEIHAFQWVQGMGKDQPIMQWIPLIKRIQSAKKSVVIDLLPGELDHFMDAVKPEGIFLCLPSASEQEEQTLLNKISRWN
jgi:hypothetical protein